MTLEGSLVVENAALRAVEQLRLEQLATEAHHDPLTGLANRRRLIEELESTVYGAGRAALRRPHARPGPVQGDQRQLRAQRRRRPALPRRAAARSRRCGRATCWRGWAATSSPSCCPAPTPPGAREVAGWIGAALRDEFVLDGMPLHVDASIGIALCPDHGRDRSLLLARADTAMYVAKRGRHGFEIWAPDGTPATRDRLQTLGAAAHRAGRRPARRPLPAQAGPARPARVIGVEALVRWNHPDRGLLYPDVFLPLAEQAGLMRRLALRVLERSLRDLQQWRARGLDLSMAVNLSVSNLQDVALPDQVEMLLDSFGVPAEALTLEITEDVLMADAARSQQVMAGAATARRPAVDRRLRHRLLVAVLPARPAGRRAEARPQLRQPPDVGRAGRGHRAQHAAAERRPGHEHGRRGRGGRRHARGAAGLGLRGGAGLSHRAARCRRTRSSPGCPRRPAGSVSLPSPVRPRDDRQDRRRASRSPADLERLAARSWRGLEEERFGDWLLRAGGGFTGRANSVLVVGDPPADLPAAIEAVTGWYARAGPPAHGPGAAARRRGGRRGVRRRRLATVEDKLVLTADLGGWPDPRCAVDLAPQPDDAWLAGYRYRGTPLPPVAREVLLNADEPVFAAVRLDPAPAPLAAVARGAVVERLAGRHRRDRRRAVPAARAGHRRHGRLGAWGAAAAPGPACCRWSRPTPRRWRSTSGWASPSTTATTTGSVRSRRAPA